MRKIIVLLVILGALFLVNNSIFADELNNESLSEKIDRVEKENDKIYEEEFQYYLTKRQKIVDTLKNSYLTKQDRLLLDEKLVELEHENMLNIIDKIEENMLKNGYIRVDQDKDEEDRISLNAASPSNLSLTDRLYYDIDRGNYTFHGYWNFTDGSWSQWEDTVDIVAFRALNRPSRIGSSVGSAYDHFGNYNSRLVTKRFEDSSGVVFNVEDTYVNPPSAPATMLTDNGRIQVNFFDSGYNKFFIDYEHNYQTSRFSASASISGISLSGVRLSVNYNRSNGNWLRSGPGRIIN